MRARKALSASVSSVLLLSFLLTGCGNTGNSTNTAGPTEKNPSTDTVSADQTDTEPIYNEPLPDVYLDETGYLYSPEMLTALYRLAGEPEVKPTFDPEIEPLPEEYQDKWYSDAVMWASYNGVSHIYWEGGDKNSSYIGGSRYGVDEDSTFSLSNYRRRLNDNYGSVTELSVPYKDWNNEVTRSDVVISLYYYLTTYLGREAKEGAAISEYADWFGENEYPSMDVKYQVISDDDGIFEKAWQWAVGSGVVRPYIDDTLRIGKSIYFDGRGKEKTVYEMISRAEYADILDRFAEYIGADTDIKSLLVAECKENPETDPVKNYPDLNSYCDGVSTLLYFHNDYSGLQSILSSDNKRISYDNGELVRGEDSKEMEVLSSERFQAEDKSLGFLALVNNSDRFTFVSPGVGGLDYGILYGDEIWLGAYGYAIDTMDVECQSDKLELLGREMYFTATASGHGKEMFKVSGRGMEEFVLEYGENGWEISGDNRKVILETGIFDEHSIQQAIEIPETGSVLHTGISYRRRINKIIR